VAAVGGVAAVSILSNLLGQHTARLKDATSENEAVDNAIPAFDADIQQIVSEYNAGSLTAAQALAATKSLDQAQYQYMHSLVGKPGTAWNGTPLPCGQPSQSTAACNSKCTVGCCIYNNVIHQPLDCIEGILAGSGSGTATFPELYPGKYSPYTRASYTLTLTKPAAAASVAANLNASIASLTGNTALTIPGVPAGSSNLLLFVVVGVIIIGALLFGFKK
jgi:hypothetical protein